MDAIILAIHIVTIAIGVMIAVQVCVALLSTGDE